MHFIPWGVDSTFHHSAKYGSNILYAHGKLAHRLYKLSGVQSKYIAALRNILDNVWKEQDLISEIDRMKELINTVPPFVFDKETGEKAVTRKESTENAVETISSFINAKRSEMEPVLNNPPVWDTPLPTKPCESSDGKNGEAEPVKSQCEDGEIFEKDGVSYKCVDGKWNTSVLPFIFST